METAETSFLILNLGVRFEQMGNADFESTVAPLPGKNGDPSAKFSCIRVRNYLVCFLPADADQVLTSKDDGRITFSAGLERVRAPGAPGSGSAASRASVRI